MVQTAVCSVLNVCTEKHPLFHREDVFDVCIFFVFLESLKYYILFSWRHTGYAFLRKCSNAKMLYAPNNYIERKRHDEEKDNEKDAEYGTHISNVPDDFRRTGYACVCGRGNRHGNCDACCQYSRKLAYREQSGCGA